MQTVEITSVSTLALTDQALATDYQSTVRLRSLITLQMASYGTQQGIGQQGQFQQGQQQLAMTSPLEALIYRLKGCFAASPPEALAIINATIDPTCQVRMADGCVRIFSILGIPLVHHDHGKTRAHRFKLCHLCALARSLQIIGLAPNGEVLTGPQVRTWADPGIAAASHDRS